MKNIDRLHQLTLDIEFLLISVIQGVALSALATFSLEPIKNSEFEYWPYIVTGFLFILIFWSGAVIHAVSFIKWPLDLNHSFIYFLASLVEIMTISQLRNPFLWFVFIGLFQLVALGLYLYDLRMIRQHAGDFINSAGAKKLYRHILGEQKQELKLFLPASLLFSAAALYLIGNYPSLFLGQKWHLALIGFQAFVSLLFLRTQATAFKKRTKLLESL